MDNTTKSKITSHGVGGGDIAAILGFSKYETPLTIFNRKTGATPKFEGNDRTRAGQFIEVAISNMFFDKNKDKYEQIDVPTNVMYAHPKYEFLIGVPDRMFVDSDENKCVLECKNTTRHITADSEVEDWKDFYCQCIWYCGITGAKYGIVAILVNGWEYIEFRVDYDAEIFAEMVERAKSFWLDNVYMGVAPAPIRSSDVLLLYPESNGKTIVLEPADPLYEKIDKRNLLQKQKKEIEDLLNEIDEAVKVRLSENEILSVFGKAVVTYKSHDQTRIDTALLKEQEPELWAKYSKTAPIRTIRYKK